MTGPRRGRTDGGAAPGPRTPGNDDELAGRVEAWLASTTQAAPADLARDVLDFLPPQARRSRLPWTPGWRLATAVAAAAIVVVSAVALLRPAIGPAAVPSAATGTNSWNPAADFQIGQAATNPAPDGYGHPDVWSYRFAGPGNGAPDAYPLLTAFDFGARAWVAPAAGSAAVGLVDGGLLLRPADAADALTVIVAWASPIEGSVTIRGFFALQSSACDGEVALSIERGAVQHWLATITPGSTAPFEVTTTVVPGVTINFTVRGLRDPACEATLLDARIVQLTAP